MEKIEGLIPEGKRKIFGYAFLWSNELTEIRIRVGRPVILAFGREEYMPDREGNRADNPEKAYCFSAEELVELVTYLCKNSLYAYEEELRQGFLTMPGGHRVGFTGQSVVEKGQIRSMIYFSSANIRINHEIIGVAKPIFPYVTEGGIFHNTLIVSPPGCGKTTMLRDLIRMLSDGTKEWKGVTVCVVDERSELAGCYRGIPQNRIGIRTDVLDRCPKTVGIMQLLRTMTPVIIAVDELGGAEDTCCLQEVSRLGVGVVATVHGKLSEIGRRYDMFSRFVILDRDAKGPYVKGIFREGLEPCGK